MGLIYFGLQLSTKLAVNKVLFIAQHMSLGKV